MALLAVVSAGTLLSAGCTASSVDKSGGSTRPTVLVMANNDGNGLAGAPAVARWNGTNWSVTPVTVTGGVGLPALTSITTADATTEWAVGYQWDGTTGQSSSIAFRITG